MTIQINDSNDLLRALRANEDFQRAVRRELLTDDLLGIPAQLVETSKTQSAILDELKDLRSNSNALQEAQNAILDTVATLLRDMGEVKTDTRAIHGMYRREHEDLRRFRGNYASHAARTDRYEIVRAFARQLSLRRVRYSVLDHDALDTVLEENYDSLDTQGFSDDALNSLPSADLIIEVSARRSSTPGFYIVVEASFTATDKDITRAAERARILRCATARDAYAVVAAVRLAPNIEGAVIASVERYLEAVDQTAAYWFPITEENMEPPDPP